MKLTQEMRDALYDGCVKAFNKLPKDQMTDECFLMLVKRVWQTAENVLSEQPTK